MKKIVVAVPMGWSSVRMNFENQQIVLEFEGETEARAEYKKVLINPSPPPSQDEIARAIQAAGKVSGGFRFNNPGARRPGRVVVNKRPHKRLSDGRGSALAILQMLRDGGVIEHLQIVDALTSLGLSSKTPKCRMSEMRIAGLIEIVEGMVAATPRGLTECVRLERAWRRQRRGVAG